MIINGWEVRELRGPDPRPIVGESGVELLMILVPELTRAEANIVEPMMRGTPLVQAAVYAKLEKVLPYRLNSPANDPMRMRFLAMEWT